MKTFVNLLIIGTSGVIAIAFGASYGRWHPLESISNNFNMHTFLICVLGIGLALSGVTFQDLIRRIDKLEETINKLKSDRK